MLTWPGELDGGEWPPEWVEDPETFREDGVPVWLLVGIAGRGRV
jgi:hypothetical protein